MKMALNLKVIAGFFLAAIVLLVLWMHREDSQRVMQTMKRANTSAHALDDSTEETLQVVAAKLSVLDHENADLRKNNEALKKRNETLSSHIDHVLSSSDPQHLKRALQDEHEQVEALKDSLSALQASQEKNASSEANKTYPVTPSEATQPPQMHWVEDKATHLPKQLRNEMSDSKGQGSRWQSLVQKESAQARAKKKDPIPFYTLPENGVAVGAIGENGLIGRIPVNGKVTDPYQFLVLLSNKNLATNGLYVPHLKKTVARGIATGDYQLSCVRGVIVSLTFTFEDGRKTTIHAKNSQEGLGWIATAQGNPCIPGRLYSDAGKFLAGQVGLGAVGVAGSALAASQTTTESNLYGGDTAYLSGSTGRYIAGEALYGGTTAAQKWWSEREKNSFDAVYVPQGETLNIIFTQDIDIDYDPEGRKVSYAHQNDGYRTRTLD